MIETYALGQTYLLNLAFKSTIAGIGSFYVALGTGPIPQGRTKTLADVTEVTGAGYARGAVSRGSWALGDGVVTSPSLTFTNSSADPGARWTDADYAVLIAETGAGATLISTCELDETIELFGGESKQISVTFSLRS